MNRTRTIESFSFWSISFAWNNEREISSIYQGFKKLIFVKLLIFKKGTHTIHIRREILN